MAVHLLCQKKAPLCTVFGECCLLGRINALFGRLIASFGTVTAFLGTLTALLGKLSALLCQNGAVSLRIDHGNQNVFQWKSKRLSLKFKSTFNESLRSCKRDCSNKARLLRSNVRATAMRNECDARKVLRTS